MTVFKDKKCDKCMLNFAKNKAKIEPKIVVNKNNRNFAKK